MSGFNCKNIILSAAAALLLSSGAAAGCTKKECETSLVFTELASKPGLKCTDFVNTFNYDELHPVPDADDYRPGVEVNYYNRLFKTHDLPKEKNLYGFTQGKCHATILNEDGTPAKFECAQTLVDSDESTLATRGVFDMATGKAKYAVLGGTGKFLGAWGEADVTFVAADKPQLGETAEMYHYNVQVFTPCPC